MKTAKLTDNRANCRVFIFYPVSALVTLFFNLVRDPQHEYAKHDIELLRAASEIIGGMPIQQVRPPTQETEYLRKMLLFLSELDRLCTHAIARSSGENNETKD